MNTMKAIWNNKIIAESENTIVIENNHYFPADSIKKSIFPLAQPTPHALGKVLPPIIINGGPCKE